MFRVRGELPNMFSGSETSDSRYMFYTDGQEQWLTKAIDDQSQGFFGEKFSNLTDAGEAASNTGAVGADIDYPVFRLADVYLMLAESVLRGGTGATRDEALQLVNKLRERAFGTADGNINEAQFTLQFILDERARELYWESCRRTDLSVLVSLPVVLINGNGRVVLLMVVQRKVSITFIPFLQQNFQQIRI